MHIFPRQRTIPTDRLSAANPHETMHASRHATPSIAIVGAGPGGLASAILLASSGARVTLYEARTDLGGRTGRWSLTDNNDPSRAYHFDRGPTFFMMPYVLDEIFAAAGRRLADEIELTRLDPMYRLLLGRPGQTPEILDTTQRIHVMAQRLERIEPGAAAAFERFIADNRRKLAAMTPILRSPIRSIFDLVSPSNIPAALTLDPLRSVYAHLGRYFKSDALRLALSFQSKYLGMSPYECPSLFSILPFIEYEYGIWHPKGGCHALIQAMARVARQLGVCIRSDAPVSRILFEGRRAHAITIDSGPHAGTHPHDQVVLNADAPWAIKNLIPSNLRAAQDSDEAIDARKYSCSTFMMYLGVEGEIDLPHHTIYVSASYKENIDDISIRKTLSRDPSLYLCNPARTDPTLAPRGDASLYVLMPTPNTTSNIGWNGERTRLRAQAFEQIHRVIGLPDLERRLRAEKLITPQDWRDMNINHGATFSLAHTLTQMLHRRPQHRMQGVDGVWLVGGGTHPGSGLPVIFLSAQITSKLLCKEVGLRPASHADYSDFSGKDIQPVAPHESQRESISDAATRVSNR